MKEKNSKAFSIRAFRIYSKVRIMKKLFTLLIPTMLLSISCLGIFILIHEDKEGSDYTYMNFFDEAEIIQKRQKYIHRLQMDFTRIGHRSRNITDQMAIIDILSLLRKSIDTNPLDGQVSQRIKSTMILTFFCKDETGKSWILGTFNIYDNGIYFGKSNSFVHIASQNKLVGILSQKMAGLHQGGYVMTVGQLKEE